LNSPNIRLEMPPPTIGQHSRAVLCELGFDAGQGDDWIRAGVVVA
jgi:hypothetical protein